MKTSQISWLLAMVVWTVFALAVPAQAAAPTVVVPERTQVCMMQDTIMSVPAIPLSSGGKTYYGCCEMCKEKIAADPNRYTRARDPLSGATVDKATAALLGVNGRVFYFESEASRSRYAETLKAAHSKTP